MKLEQEINPINKPKTKSRLRRWFEKFIESEISEDNEYPDFKIDD